MLSSRNLVKPALLELLSGDDLRVTVSVFESRRSGLSVLDKVEGGEEGEEGEEESA